MRLFISLVLPEISTENMPLQPLYVLLDIMVMRDGTRKLVKMQLFQCFQCHREDEWDIEESLQRQHHKFS
jgi:hypothetical protein